MPPEVPGVHIEELDRQPRPVQGVAVSVAGIVGRTEWGPEGARFVSSWNNYRRMFGSFVPTSEVPYAAFQYFNQGGNQLWVSRVLGPSAVEASVEVDNRDGGTAGTFTAKWKGDYGNDIAVEVRDAIIDSTNRFRILVFYKGNLVEQHEELSVVATDPDFAPTVINRESLYVNYEHSGGATVDDRPAVGTRELGGGTDDWDSVTPTHWLGEDTAGRRTGINAFTEVREITDVAAPGITDPAIRQHLVDHAETMAQRVASLDVGVGMSPAAAASDIAGLDSKYVQFLYNRMAMSDPLTGQPKMLSPTVWYLGLRARAATELGVHESAANIPVRGALAVEMRLSDGDLALLTRSNINPFIADRGFRLWGSRLGSSDPLWRYVTDRYFFNFAEQSLAEAMRWAVHRTNHPDLWRALRRTVRPFLEDQAQAGALVGGEGVGYFILADETINDATTPYIYIDIGLATGKPSEFIVLRFSLHDGAVAVQEGAA